MSPGHSRDALGGHFAVPGPPWELRKVTWGLEKVVPEGSQAKTSKMSPYFCKTLENAETVIKNRGPQKPVLVSEREARKLVLKVQLYPAKHVLGRVLPTKHCKKRFCIPGRAHEHMRM